MNSNLPEEDLLPDKYAAQAQRWFTRDLSRRGDR